MNSSKDNKNYYKNLDLIRVLACIAVFLYHMNILKGGYLAVCTFFVLNGYLNYLSCHKKDKFTFKEYYINKLKRIYLPLIVVVFSSIAVISLFKNITWFNLKPETTSILLGYNNFWQLGANLDYFARHVTSPFMHLWYIAIIMQFELIFPFIYKLSNKIKEKHSKAIPLIILTILSILSIIYFGINSYNQNIMIPYYDTLSRIFSLLLGVSLGYINSNYSKNIIDISKNKYLKDIIFIIYLTITIILFITIKSTSSLFGIAMILTTIISCRLINYGTIQTTQSLSLFDKFINKISSITYEIYLVQYPIIFIFQHINLNSSIKLILIILITLIISYILHYILNYKGNSKTIKIIFLSIILLICSFGTFKYLTAEDHKEELKELETKLLENEKVMKQQQEEYINKIKQEKEDWTETLNKLENYENELHNIINDLNLVGIGDSVMLGAIPDLKEQFKNGYFDAQISRTAWVVNDILKDLKQNNILGDPIIINLGSNGDCSTDCKDKIMNTIGDKKVFWINSTNDLTFNKNILNYSKKHDNLYIIDWYEISKGHQEYFYADNIHLTKEGRKVYTQTIHDEIYKVYLNEYNQKKNEILNKHEQEEKSKISLIGNNLLLNAYTPLKEKFNNADFIINSDYTYKTLKQEIINKINNNTLNHKIFFIFDKNTKISYNQYKELINLCKEHQIYIIDINNKLSNLEDNNITIINFYKEITNNKNYVMYDRVHLTEEGNQALVDLISSYINKK